MDETRGLDMTLNCREAQGLPSRDHACTGGRCQCSCHGCAPPDNFREMVAAARRAAKKERS